MRKICITDVEAIFSFCQLLKAENARMSFTDVESKTDIIKWIEDDLIYLYGDFSQAGVLMGLVKATRGKDNKSHSAYLAAAVHPDFRKHQIASTLTNFVLGELKKEGIKIARTYIYSWNKASIATIEKCGFIQSGRVVMHEYDEITQAYIDDLIYYKMI